MANTLIQLKYSTVTDIPVSLNTAEPAYSYSSNTLFIGNPAGNGTLNIGGYFYTKTIDDATDASTPGTLVLRDAQGSASFNVITGNLIIAEIDGNSNSATQLKEPFDLGLDGDVTGNVSIDGAANVTLTVELVNTGVNAGSYGSTTQIPVFTVDEDGRLTDANTVNVATTLAFSADGPTTGSLDLLTDTFTLEGGDGITTTANDTTNTIVVDVDNTVIRTTGNQSITGDLGITGNLIVSGNTITLDTETIRVNDSIMLLAANNDQGDLLDIGMTAHYGVGGNNHTGLVRHAADGKWYLFENYTDHFIHDFNTINIADPTFVTANLVANITGGKVSGLTEVIVVSDGGTGQNTFTTGSIIIGNGTGGLLELANTTSTGTYANASHVPVITVDEYGRVSNVVNTLIDIDTSQVTTGILGVPRGGTGANTFTTNGVLLGQGTSAITTVSSSTEGHVLTINSSGVPTFEMISGGTF
jgi:hypothetical protein